MPKISALAGHLKNSGTSLSYSHFRIQNALFLIGSDKSEMCIIFAEAGEWGRELDVMFFSNPKTLNVAN